MLGRYPSRQQRTAGRAALHQPNGPPNRGVERAQTAVRQHQHQGRSYTELVELIGEVGEIGGHQRLYVRVGAGGGQALVFANLRAYLGRKRH